MRDGRRFSSKLLLFGEYGIILGSKALCLPFSTYSGILRLHNGSDNAYAISSNLNIRRLFEYICRDSILSPLFNVSAFEADLNRGLYFDSSIPEGYGIGSSGALCAALYDRYCLVKEEDIFQLKSHLGRLEALFHGKSSGIDPLVSYLDTSLIVSGSNLVCSVDIDFNLHGGQLFLVDTGIKRSSNNLISNFIGYMQSADNSGLKQTLIELTDKCVDSIASGGNITEALRLLSGFQLKYMNSLIPQHLHELWEEGIASGTYCLKISGAGGGGFLIGFTRNPDYVRDVFAENSLNTLFFNV